MSKSVSTLISSGRLLLLVKQVKGISTFGVFDFESNQLLFTQTIPYVRADTWTLSESLGLLACVGIEDGIVSTFDAVDGVVKSGFRAVPGNGVLFYDGTLRILDRTAIHVFDLQGKRLAMQRIPNERSKDLGKYVISKNGSRYDLLDSTGKHLSDFASNGVGITSCALSSRGLVVAESRGPLTLFDEAGKIVWQKASPKEFHPIRVACGPSDWIYTIHAYLPTLGRSILTVQSKDGAILAQEEFDVCPPVCTFASNLPGWIIGSLETFEFKDEKFRRIPLEIAQSTFDLEKYDKYDGNDGGDLEAGRSGSGEDAEEAAGRLDERRKGASHQL